MRGLFAPLRSRRVLALAALSLAALGVASCSNQDGRVPVYKVKGQVLCNNRPTEQALVVFHPVGDNPQLKDVRPVGRVAPDGTFTLTTYTEGDGAPAGDYVVTVDWRRPNPGTDGADVGPSLIPARYNVPTASNLKATVTTGSNDLQPFRLTSR